MGIVTLKSIVSLLAFVLWALPAAALTPVEQVVAALEAKGYQVIVQERTWLGRLRIVAVTNEYRREMVINPGTGEVLRDYAEALYQHDGDSSSSSGSQVATTAAPSGVAGGGTSVSAVDLGTGVSAAAPVAAMEAPTLVLSDPLIIE